MRDHYSTVNQDLNSVEKACRDRPEAEIMFGGSGQIAKRNSRSLHEFLCDIN